VVDFPSFVITFFVCQLCFVRLFTFDRIVSLFLSMGALLIRYTLATQMLWSGEWAGGVGRVIHTFYTEIRI